VYANMYAEMYAYRILYACISAYTSAYTPTHLRIGSYTQEMYAYRTPIRGTRDPIRIHSYTPTHQAHAHDYHIHILYAYRIHSYTPTNQAHAHDYHIHILYIGILSHTHTHQAHAHDYVSLSRSHALALTPTCTHTFFLPHTHTHTRHIHATEKNSVVRGKGVASFVCKYVCAHDLLKYAKTHTYTDDSTL